MKIIGGTWKGISLQCPPEALSRPTQERVKKSLFDILGERVKGSGVLDLFAGSGSLGIEALSRGAEESLFVEWNPVCIGLLKENLKRVRAEKDSCLEGNALKVIGKLFRDKRRFDIIFVDPPYSEGVTTKCLHSLGKYDILSPAAILVIRHGKEDSLPFKDGILERNRQERYGQTVLSFYRKGLDHAASGLPGQF